MEPIHQNSAGKLFSATQGNVTIILLGILIGLVVWNSFNPVAKQLKWEYKIESVPDLRFTESINKIGNDGWELVFARRASSGEGHRDTQFSYEMIFKRAKK